MKKLLCLTVLMALVAITSSASANVVIDDFSTATSIDGNPALPLESSATGALDDNIAGTFTYSLASSGAPIPAAATVFSSGGNNTSATLANVGDSLTLTYNFTTSADFGTVGSPDTINLDLFNLVTAPLDLVFTVSGGAGTESFATRSVAGGVQSFATGDLATAGLASSIDSLTVLITSTQAFTQFTATGASITAVPEPASMLLLGLTSMGGAAIYRRRRRNADAETAIAA